MVDYAVVSRRFLRQYFEVRQFRLPTPEFTETSANSADKKCYIQQQKKERDVPLLFVIQLLERPYRRFRHDTEYRVPLPPR